MTKQMLYDKIKGMSEADKRKAVDSYFDKIETILRDD
jgi:hypothetical protein